MATSLRQPAGKTMLLVLQLSYLRTEAARTTVHSRSGACQDAHIRTHEAEEKMIFCAGPKMDRRRLYVNALDRLRWVACPVLAPRTCIQRSMRVPRHAPREACVSCIARRSDGAGTHAVATLGDFIFDSTEVSALLLTRASLDRCVGSHLNGATFSHVARAIRLIPSKSLCKRLRRQEQRA